MIYAVIKDGVVKNTIVVDDPDFLKHVQGEYDATIQVDQLTQRPGPGDLYDGSKFIRPETQEVIGVA